MQIYFILGRDTSDRVSIAIEKSPFSDSQIGNSVGVSPTTVWRWRNKETKRFSERDLKALAKKLHVRYEWLQFGEAPMSNDENLNLIEYAVTEKGESYKGLDQTLSTVESKASRLRQDLKSLIDDIRKLRSSDDS